MPSTINATPTSSGLVQSADASGVLALQTGGTTAVTIDGSQNVGIGTSSPADNLDVYGNARVGQGQVVADSTVGKIGIHGGVLNGSGTAQLGFFGKSVSNTGLTYELGRISGGNFGSFGIDGGLSFSTSANNGSNILTLLERMRIDSSGQFLVNKSSSLGTGFGQQQIGFDGNSRAGLTVHNTDTSAATQNSITFHRNASQVGTVTTTNSSTAYNTSSDYRLKENIEPMTEALNKVAQLKPVTYDWKVGGSSQGFIAHELAEVCPDAVNGEKDAVDAEGNIKPQGIDTSFLVATLTAAIQEQQALIIQLQADVAALKVQP